MATTFYWGLAPTRLRKVAGPLGLDSDQATTGPLDLTPTRLRKTTRPLDLDWVPTTTEPLNWGLARARLPATTEPWGLPTTSSGPPSPPSAESPLRHWLPERRPWFAEPPLGSTGSTKPLVATPLSWGLAPTRLRKVAATLSWGLAPTRLRKVAGPLGWDSAPGLPRTATGPLDLAPVMTGPSGPRTASSGLRTVPPGPLTAGRRHPYLAPRPAIPQTVEQLRGSTELLSKPGQTTF